MGDGGERGRHVHQMVENKVQWVNESYKRMVMKKLEYYDGQSSEYCVFR